MVVLLVNGLFENQVYDRYLYVPLGLILGVYLASGPTRLRSNVDDSGAIQSNRQANLPRDHDVMRAVIFLLSGLLPWSIRRVVLSKTLGYQLHPTSRIGWCLLVPRRLVMEEHSSVGHLTVCKGVDLLHLRPHAVIGRLNWITGYPLSGTQYYDGLERKPELVLDEHSAITHRHILDCTDAITIGSFTTVAGYRSQLLTHSVDLVQSRQSARRISIGSYCFVGTDCVLLGGSVLPDYSVLAAKSLLNRSFDETHSLYGGVPSVQIASLPPDMLYFTRKTGHVT